MSRAAQRRQQSQDAEFGAALLHVMQSPQGRRFVWGILDLTGLHASLMTGNSETFYRVGRRDVGLSLLVDLKTHAFVEFRQMEDEQRIRDHRVDLEREAEENRVRQQEENE